MRWSSSPPRSSTSRPDGRRLIIPLECKGWKVLGENIIKLQELCSDLWRRHSAGMSALCVPANANSLRRRLEGARTLLAVSDLSRLPRGSPLGLPRARES